MDAQPARELGHAELLALTLEREEHAQGTVDGLNHVAHRATR
jgi:hypothetical protein